MSVSINYLNKKMYRANNRQKNAYRPRPPFRSVEGIKSLAWDKLSPHAVWVLMEFYRKFDGYNRSNLTLSYSEVKIKMANGTFNKSIWELIGYGFIDVIRFGRLERNNSLYALTNRWKSLNEDSRRIKKVEKLLSHLERVKRINTPKNLSEEQTSEFRIKRRQMIRKIQNMILKA
jgi:hypothetical protein